MQLLNSHSDIQVVNTINTSSNRHQSSDAKMTSNLHTYRHVLQIYEKEKETERISGVSLMNDEDRSESESADQDQENDEMPGKESYYNTTN